jgi:hypothetical protein
MASETTSNSIPKLNPSNYHPWYAEIRALLREKGYWGIIHGTVTLPAEKSHEVVLAKEKALGLIHRSVEPALMAEVIDLEDPKAVLDKLKAIYGVSNAGTRFNALKSFLSITQQPNERISYCISADTSV